MKRLLSSACSIPVVVGMALTLMPTLHTSEEGLTHIAQQEGCVKCKYVDAAGYATVGVGHRTSNKGPQSLSDEEVGRLYALDVNRAETCVMEHLDGHYMPQSVLDASVSLVFNTGCAGAITNPKTGKHTHFYRAAQSHDWEGTCYYLGDFIYAGGKPILRNRRAADQSLCIKDINNVGSPTTDTP